eukprot:TRINITY_DN29187_c0_g1_i1.p1 TRINITY_DN29187_c0_g1~~TRINITY_DN29187_c0_g1_i1.p1  ORF type:complete len:366 (-),score=57.05 TRINITY_DN29187_c0_g1_i1:41-1138(-)
MALVGYATVEEGRPSSDNGLGSSDNDDFVLSLPTGGDTRRRWILAALVACMCTVGIVAAYKIPDTGADDMLTAVYLIVQIVTTVGYGDMTPGSESVRLMLAFYILLLILVGAYALNVATGVLLEKEVAFLRKRMRRLENFEEGSSPSSRYMFFIASTMFCSAIFLGTAVFRYLEHCTCSYGVTWREADHLDHDACLEYTLGITFDQCVAAGGFVKTWIDCFYLSVVTVTTVGFGDFSPKSWSGRCFAVFWMVYGVACAGFFMTTMSELLFEDSGRVEYEGALHIDRDTFDAIDEDGNGSLSRAEYSMFVLVRHQLVSPEIMQEINRKFDSMDLDHTGGVTWAEISRSRSAALAALREAQGDEHSS